MSILDKYLEVEMPDNSRWAVPIRLIAEHRAAYYAKADFDEFGGDVALSLKEDTEPLFESDHYEIEDWAQNNMNWKDVKPHAKQIALAKIDWEDGWCNGEKRVITLPTQPN